MTPQENRDNLVKRIIDQKQSEKRTSLTANEKRDVEKYVQEKIMPDVYRKK